MALAMLVMTGRVTRLGLSRWTGPGGSDRTVQRFFATGLPWATLLWVCFRQHVDRVDEVYLLVGDEGVATKAGTPPMAAIVALRVSLASRGQGSPSSRCPSSASSRGARSRSASSRSCAATPPKRPARPERLPRSRLPPPPSAVQGVPKGARTRPKLPGPSRRSSGASLVCLTPYGHGSLGVWRGPPWGWTGPAATTTPCRGRGSTTCT